MKKDKRFCNPEIWGGIECTINRVGDRYRSQLQYSGHLLREDDIDKVANLGIKKMRYPILWEAHQPHAPNDHIDWRQTEKQLDRLAQYDIEPIAGLVHHGSGPRYTSLLDPAFGEKLAAYALRVAERFPQINYYTPVNEPLTTARFSGLYGLWYPHEMSDESFVLCLLNQLKGVVLSMKAIRSKNPGAKLVQTEDLGHIHSSPALAYQARFENQRRWLTFDILCGRVDDRHPLWNYLTSTVPTPLLEFFLENPCPPDIIGLNYYVTSERYLDENTDRYPPHCIGTNGRHEYADVEAVRVKKMRGLKHLIRQCSRRYPQDLAITEVHLKCTREEQMRWFKEVWDISRELKADGIPLKAMTAWSLLGAFDWNSLLTREAGIYESGAFELQANKLRPTALTKIIKSLATSGEVTSPLLQEKGWWHKSYPGAMYKRPKKQTPLLIFGPTGTLGAAFLKICERRGIAAVGVSRGEANVTSPAQIKQTLEKYKPWAVINATGFVRVDDAENEIDACFDVNAHAPGHFAHLCNQYGLPLLSFSTDLVFDGDKNSPYTEADHIRPLNIYGKSKAAGEKLMLDGFSDSLIIRTSAFFGPWDKYNFAYFALQELNRGNSFDAVDDIKISPTYVPHLVDRSLDLLIDEEKGIWHLANEGEITWKDYACELAKKSGLCSTSVHGKKSGEMNWIAPRPRYSVITSDKGNGMPTLEQAIEQFFNEKMN